MLIERKWRTLRQRAPFIFCHGCYWVLVTPPYGGGDGGEALLNSPAIQCCRIPLGISHMLGVGHGKVVGATEVGLSTHI